MNTMQTGLEVFKAGSVATEIARKLIKWQKISQRNYLNA